MSDEVVVDPPTHSGPMGFVTQSPMAFGVMVFALYWIAKILRPVDQSRPPRAPYWIPWVGSALDIGKDPDGFFNNMSKLLGPMFRVKILGQETIYVTSPSLISQIFRDSKNFDFINIRTEMGEKLFAINPQIVRNEYMLDTYMPELHHILLPNNIKPMTSVYLHSVHDALRGMISSVDGASGPLKSFIIPPAYRAAAFAGFGSRFPAEKSYPLFQAFDDDFYLLGANIPRMFLSKPIKAWEKLLDLFEDYLVDLENSEDPVPPFVQVALSAKAKDNWSYRDVATVLACQLWALQANAIFAAYWLIALLVQQDEGLGALAAELDEARFQWQAAHPSTPVGPSFFDEICSSSKSLPLLSSAIQEVLRYTSSTFSPRHVTGPVALGGYQLRAGDKIICATRQVHIDDEVHPQASQFDIRRYLETPRAMKEGKLVANHSMPFGGGVSMCEGRHFAMTELRMFIAIFLTYATVEMDEGCLNSPEFLSERIGLGIMHPRGDMDVIVRKRKL